MSRRNRQEKEAKETLDRVTARCPMKREETAASCAGSTIENGVTDMVIPSKDMSLACFKMSDSSDRVPRPSNGETEEDSYSDGETKALFHRLCYTEDVLSALPNRTWGIHVSEVPEKRVVVSTLVMQETHDSGLQPIYTKQVCQIARRLVSAKTIYLFSLQIIVTYLHIVRHLPSLNNVFVNVVFQIVFDEKLNFNLYLINSRMVLKDKPTRIATMHDFEDLVDYVNNLKVCAGGPPIRRYSNVNPECAYRDSLQNWRHNLCSLEIVNGAACESCLSLDEILRRAAQRSSKRSKR